MTDEAHGNIRNVPAEEHWAHFARSWTTLKSYTYLGKGTPFLDKGVDVEAMTLRHDMRNSTGGIMAAPLCILAPEPWWRDDECIPAPVTMAYEVLDPARDVTRLEVVREVISIGRQMGFSRSRIVDADDRDRVVAISIGSGVSLGDVPPGFEPVDNPVDQIEDSADLPPLREVFGVLDGADGTVRIETVTPEHASPHGALHQGPLNIALEAAVLGELTRRSGTSDFQIENWTILMVKPGMVGPFVASATAMNAHGARVGVEATMTDQGSGGRIIATASSVFRRIGH